MPEHPSAGHDRAPAHPEGGRRTPPSVPDHELLRRIGQGAYGEVWLARNAVGTLRAVKVVYRDAFADARPYEREFEGIQKFEPLSRTHEGLVDVLQIGLNEQAGYFYYVMELADAAVPRVAGESELRVEGSAPADSLSHRMGEGRGEGNPSQLSTQNSLNSYSPRTLASDLKSQGRLPFAQCLRTALALADALEHLHQQGLIHRDIKPSNIIFVNGTPKLADIGLVTETGAGKSWVGTEGFMPPEGPGTAQGDVYSLGKVLYEISTGKDRQRFPEPLTALGDLPDHADWLEFNAIVLKACQPRAADRYATAAVLRKELELLQAGQSIRQLHATQRQLARLKTWVLPAAALAIVGTVVWAVLSQSRHERRWREAQSLLREVQMIRQTARTNGWFDSSWAKLRKVARLKVDDDARTQAAACLNWADAKLVDANTNSGAFSLAYSPDGQWLLCAGMTDRTGTNAARLWRVAANQIVRSSRREAAHSSLGKDQSLLTLAATNETSASLPLPVFGDAVAAWRHDGVAVLFQPGDSNNFVLRKANAARVLQDFPLAGKPRQGNEHHPVIALSSNAHFATASVVLPNETGRFAVWNSETGKLLRQFEEPASALAFSPHGRALAVGDTAGRVRVFSVPDFALLAEFPSARVRINCFAFTRDPIVPRAGPLTNAWWLAVGDAGGTIRVFRTATGEQLNSCRGSVQDVFTLAFHPDGVTLASAGRFDLRLWDVVTGTQLLRMTDVLAPRVSLDYARAVGFSSDGRRLCLANEQQSWFRPSSISVWELGLHHGVQRLQGLAAQVSKVWLSPDGNWLAGLAHDWRLGVWEIPSGRLRWIFETPRGDAADNAGVVFRTSDATVTASMGDGAVRWRLADGTVAQSWRLPWGYCDDLGLDRHDQLWALRRESAGRGATPSSWTLRRLDSSPTGQVVLTRQDAIDWHPLHLALALNRDCLLAAGDSAEAPAKFWRVECLSVPGGAVLWSHRNEQRDIESAHGMTLDPMRRQVLRASGNHAALCELPSGEERVKLPSVHPFAPNADIFARVTPMGYEVVFGRAANAPALVIGADFHPSLLRHPTFGGTGKHLAWGTESGVILVVDLPNVLERLAELKLDPRKQ